MKESQREGRHGSSPAAWSDEGCAQHRQESSACKVQLKEATPALSERERSSTASFGLPGQQGQQRNWTGALRPCLETAVWREGRFACRFAG